MNFVFRIAFPAQMRRCAALLPALTLLVLGLSAPPASAAVKCRYNATSHALSVTATESGLTEGEAVLSRVGDQISVSESLGPGVYCHGSPTVTNTDSIKVIAAGSLSSATISLSGGPFAPGASPESDSSSEIELTVGGEGFIFLIGGPNADHFRYMTAEGRSGLNLDSGPGDRDIDLFVSHPGFAFILSVDGGEGPDTIDVVGHPKLLAEADGGDGNDTLIARGAGPLGSILSGGPGRDLLIGGPAFDLFHPDGGADVVRSLGGSDAIEMQPDKRRDSVDCGGGQDKVIRPDPFDRLRSCERVKRGRRH